MNGSQGSEMCSIAVSLVPDYQEVNGEWSIIVSCFVWLATTGYYFEDMGLPALRLKIATRSLVRTRKNTISMNFYSLVSYDVKFCPIDSYYQHSRDNSPYYHKFQPWEYIKP